MGGQRRVAETGGPQVVNIADPNLVADSSMNSKKVLAKESSTAEQTYVLQKPVALTQPLLNQ